MASQSQIINLGNIYAAGCEVSQVSGSSTDLLISVGQVRDATNTFDIIVNTPLTLSTTFVGAGGLDTGTIASNTFYAVYVIYDASGRNPVSCLLSTASKNPVMPSLNGTTFSNYRVVGYIKTDGSAGILGFSMVGSSNSRELLWDNNISVLIAGAATTYTPVSLAVAVPSIIGTSDFPQLSVAVDVTAAITPAVAGNSVFLANLNEALTQESTELSGSVAAVRQAGQLHLAANFGAALDFRIKYRVAAGATDLQISAFRFSI